MFFDLNPLDKPDALWQHWVLAIVAGLIGFMIGYISRQRQAEALENQLATLETEVDDCLNTPVVKFERTRRETPPLAAPVASIPVPATPKAVAFAAPVAPDDLKIVEGIGPKIEELLNHDGILTFAQLAAASPERLRQVLVAAGPRFQIADPSTWPQQAQLAADGQWDDLKILQNKLTAGRT
ncbi:MAG: hypothetical protein LH606_20875 [Cytophagaceae bacterium]|nr:hypothetical protein [Cytophagaceae bacterium]